MKKLLVAALLGLASTTVNAQVVAGGTVGGFGTFVDVNTNRVWLRMDNFFDESADQMLAAAQAQGFSFATQADVNQLLGSLPLNGGQWSSYAAIMGQAPTRDLIWGAYEGSNPGSVGWAFAYSDYQAWSVIDNVDSSGSIPNEGSPEADLNLWAFQTGTPSVPEPASWAMMVGGFGVVGGALRGRRKATISFA
jgi:hypothetical protein